MSDRPWMPLDIDDYLADTTHLSAAEHGAYMLLIMRYWKDGRLPSDEKLVMRLSRLTPEQWAESRDVLAAFFSDGWTHKRIDAEIEKASGIIEKRRAAATARHAKSKPYAHAEQVQSRSSDTGVPPVTDNQPSSLRSDGSRERYANPAIVLQSVLDPATSQRWVSHCTERGKRPSSQQAEMQASVLRELKRLGLSPPDSIRHAIAKGWFSLNVEYFRNAGLLKDEPEAAVGADEWGKRLAVWKQSRTWAQGWGPKPGEPGCLVPADLLKAAA